MAHQNSLLWQERPWPVGQAVKTSASHADNAGSIPARVTTRMMVRKYIRYMLDGVFDDEDPPVPIPNTEVKLIGAENTWLETAWEDRAMPSLS